MAVCKSLFFVRVSMAFPRVAFFDCVPVKYRCDKRMSTEILPCFCRHDTLSCPWILPSMPKWKTLMTARRLSDWTSPLRRFHPICQGAFYATPIL